jgi:DNA repair protein RecO (recombination protein O)
VDERAVRNRTELSEALLLRSVDYGDADRIVTLLTQRFGKAAFIARAARRSKKRFGGALSPLALLNVEVGLGKGALGALVQAQVTRAFPRVLGDLARMHAGFAALELLRELSPEHEPDPAVFATAVALLGELEAGAAAPACALVCFEARLLALTGFSPQLDRCGLCGKQADPERAALFDPRQGHLVCRACGGGPHRLSGAARMRLARSAGPDWIDAAREPWPPRDLAEARAALREFIEQRIGRELKAASLLPATLEER